MNDKKVQITIDEISEVQRAEEPTAKQEFLKTACDKIEELALLDFGQLSPDSCIFVDRILIKSDGSFICKLVEHRTITVPERKLNIADNELRSIKESLMSFVSEQTPTKKWPPLELGNN